jgi:hypothetical protein
MTNFKVITSPYISKRQISDVIKTLQKDFTPLCGRWEWYQPSVYYTSPLSDDLMVTDYRNFIIMKYEHNKKVFAKKFIFDMIMPKD